MLYILKINEYLKVLKDDEVKDFVATSVSEYFKSIREGENLRKIVKLPYIFITIPEEVEKCNQIILIIAYIAAMLRFVIFLI